jgi:purine-binding chemotaxis protein CheW
MQRSRESRSYIEVLLDRSRVAFPLDQVERVVRVVALHNVPGAVGCLAGTINVAGDLVSVYDSRKLLGLPGRPLRLSDRIVISLVPARCGLLVDDVLGIVEPQELKAPESFSMHAAGVRGIVHGRDNVLMVHDLRRLLALERAIPVSAHG